MTTFSDLCCFSKDTNSPLYLATEARMNALTNREPENYYEARLAEELLISFGGDEFIHNNGIVSTYNNPSLYLIELAKRIAPRMTYNTQIFHSKQNVVKSFVSDRLAETIISETFLQVNLAHTYDGGSHKIGSDIYLIDEKCSTNKGYGLSIKTGTTTSPKPTNTPILNLSGSRTTTYKEIADKLSFFKRSSPNGYIAFSRPSKAKMQTDGSTNDVNYTVYLFEGSEVNLGESRDWIINKQGFKFESDKLTATITKSMSDQLWLKVKMAEINCVAITIRIKIS